MPWGDVANVALNHFRAIHNVDIADKLHMPMLAPFGFQRQVVVTDILLALQFPECALARGDIPEGADFPEPLAEQLGVGVPQQFLEEGVCGGDLSRVRIQDEDAVLCHLEESPVAYLGYRQ